MNDHLLLLPGLNNTGHVFDDVIAALPPGLHAQAPDLPPLDTVEAIADAVLAEAPERFWLAGFSFGGYVAMAVLDRAPERVQGIALLCSLARADPPQAAPQRRQAMATAQDGGYEQMATSSTAPFHPDSLSNTALMQRRRDIVRAYGAERFIEHLKATMARPDRRPLLDGKKPTLMVTTSHDAVVSPKAVRDEAAQVPGARLVSIDAAGHLLPLEKPQALAEVLAAWIGGAKVGVDAGADRG